MRQSTMETMSVGVIPETHQLEETEEDLAAGTAVPWVVIVWNDPVNLMCYVTAVVQTYFGYSEAKARTLMLEVHEQGRSVVSTGSREQAERDTVAMHSYGLWATFQTADA